MKDPAALALITWWAALAAAFSIGWLRCGNGHWRWRQATEPCAANAPLFGIIALACITSLAWYTFVAEWNLPATGRIWAYRGLREIPLLGVFTAVALIRRPWQKDTPA